MFLLVLSADKLLATLCFRLAPALSHSSCEWLSVTLVFSHIAVTLLVLLISSLSFGFKQSGEHQSHCIHIATAELKICFSFLSSLCFSFCPLPGYSLTTTCWAWPSRRFLTQRRLLCLSIGTEGIKKEVLYPVFVMLIKIEVYFWNVVVNCKYRHAHVATGCHHSFIQIRSIPTFFAFKKFSRTSWLLSG